MNVIYKIKIFLLLSLVSILFPGITRGVEFEINDYFKIDIPVGWSQIVSDDGTKTFSSPSNYSVIQIIPFSAVSTVPEEDKYSIFVKNYEALERSLNDQAGLSFFISSLVETLDKNKSVKSSLVLLAALFIADKLIQGKISKNLPSIYLLRLFL